MSVLYVRSTTGNDANNGSSWAQAKSSIAGALSSAGAGDIIYVSQAHNYITTNANISYPASKGTPSSPIVIACVNDSEQPPTQLANTAVENCMTTSYTMNFQYDSSIYWYGINFKSSNQIFMPACCAACTFNSCSFQITGAYHWYFLPTGAATRWGYIYYNLRFINTVFTTNSASTSFYFNNANSPWTPTDRGAIPWLNHSNLIFQGCSWTGTASLNLFNIVSANTYINAFFDGCDLSILDAASNFISNTANLMPGSKFSIRNCKLSASASLYPTSLLNYQQPDIMIDNSDSVGTLTHYEWHRYQGIIKMNTDIVRVGGASNGLTGFTYQMTGGPNVSFLQPLDSPAIMVWCNSAGIERTAVIEFVHDNLQQIGASDIWIDLEYPGSDVSTISSFISTKVSAYPILISSSASPPINSQSIWLSTRLSKPSYQKFQVKFTPKIAGLVTAKVYLSRENYTVYVDPMITLI